MLTPSEDRGSSPHPPCLAPSPKLAHFQEETLEDVQGEKAIGILLSC